jgi:hypothetical protein
MVNRNICWLGALLMRPRPQHWFSSLQSKLKQLKKSKLDNLPVRTRCLIKMLPVGSLYDGATDAEATESGDAANR